MSLFLVAILGAIAGYLAARAMGFPVDPFVGVGVGMIGAVLGIMVLRLALSIVNTAATLVAAAAGTLALIWLWRVFVERR